MLLLIATLSASIGLAQTQEPEIVYKKELELDFEVFKIKGKLKGPNGKIINEPMRAAFNPLITLRQNFSQEMTKSVSQIR